MRHAMAGSLYTRAAPHLIAASGLAIQFLGL